MDYAQLQEADLLKTDFRGASLVGVNFTSADLTGADLRDTDLTYATFDEAELDGVLWTMSNSKEEMSCGTTSERSHASRYPNALGSRSKNNWITWSLSAALADATTCAKMDVLCLVSNGRVVSNT